MKQLIKENNMLKIKAVRHGEVLLVPVDKIPKGVGVKHTSFIVGHSETGHHHVLESKTEFDVYDKAMLYIQLFQPADLVHQKSVNAHKTLTVPKGIYKIIHKQEYSPFSKAMEKVFD